MIPPRVRRLTQDYEKLRVRFADWPLIRLTGTVPATRARPCAFDSTSRDLATPPRRGNPPRPRPVGPRDSPGKAAWSEPFLPNKLTTLTVR